MAYLVSLTEREATKQPNFRGVPSPLPERYGADFLIFSPSGRGGIQRKKFPEDLFASLQDGRLNREIVQLAHLEFKMFVIEGNPAYTSDGYLVDEGYSRWHRSNIRNLLRSLKIQHGIDVEWSYNIEDTVDIVNEVEKYLKTGVHLSLLTRQKDGKDDWGSYNSRDWARFFLQGFPGIGAIRAEAIFDAYGRVPLKWDTTREEMKSRVYGVGDKTVESLWKVLQ